MIFITSINGKNTNSDIQGKAIDTWMSYSYPVYSINNYEEKNILEWKYGQVNFIQVNRTGFGIFGKPCVYINDIIKHAHGISKDYICICNSDIEIHIEPKRWEQLFKVANKGIVIFSRCDYEKSIKEPIVYSSGFDMILYHKKFSHLFQRTKLCFGQPFWDFWFPWSMIKNKVPVFKYMENCIYHQKHYLNWSRENWYRTVEIFCNENDMILDVHSQVANRIYKIIQETVVKITNKELDLL